jgi:glycosyltransferase involved in cell wall biosynthesis
VVTCFNEEEVLANTVNRVLRGFENTSINLELVLVDNGSTDSTGQIIDALIAGGAPATKAIVEVNEGYGKGVLCGMRAAHGRFVGLLCADGQVDTQDLVRIYDIAANAKRPCMTKVRRRFRMDGLTRKVVSTIYNIGTTILFGNLGSIDINGNPKIIPRDYLERMNLTSKDWFLDAEIMIKAKRLNLPVLELNVMAQMREGGTSHVRPGTCWEFVKNLAKYRFGGISITTPLKHSVEATNRGLTSK